MEYRTEWNAEWLELPHLAQYETLVMDMTVGWEIQLRLEIPRFRTETQRPIEIHKIIESSPSWSF